MNEKINLFELDINIDALTQNSAKALQEVKSLEDGQKDLKKTTTDLRKEMDEYKKALKNPEIKKNSIEANELNAKLKDAQQRYAENTTAQVKNQASLKASRKEYQLSLKMLDAYGENQMNQIEMVTKTNGSIDQLSAALSKNKAVYKSLSKEQRENSEIGTKLKNIISEQDKEYKKLHVEMGNTNVMVGSYKEEMKKALGETNLFTRAKAQLMGVMAPFIPLFKYLNNELKGAINGYRNAATGTKEYTAAQKAATIAQNLGIASLKLLKVAFIATGIGAFVVLLGSLVAWFKSTQKGADKLGKILAQVGAVVDVIVDRFAKFGGIFVKLITGQSSLSEAWNEGKEAAKGMIDEVSREAKLAGELKEITQDLAKQEQLLAFQRAAANTKIKEQNLIVEDTTKSLEERMKAAKEIERLETELADKELKNAQQSLAVALGKKEVDEASLKTLSQLSEGTKEYDALLKELGLSESTQEDVEALLSAFEKSEAAQQRSLEIRTTNQNKLNTIQKEAAAKAIEEAKKQTEAALAESKTRLEIYVAENEGKAKTLGEQLAFEQTIHDKLLEQYKAELEAKKLTKSEYDLALIQAQQDLLHRQAELTVENAAQELDLYIANNQSKLDADKNLTDESVRQEEERLYSIYEKQLEFYQLQKEQGLLNESDFNLQKLQLQQEYLEQQKALDKEFDTQKLERSQTDWENEMQVKALRGESEFDLQRAELNRQYDAEIANAKKTGADIKLINNKYAEENKAITLAENKAKRESYASMFGDISELLGKNTAAGKAAAIAQATINTYQGVTEVWTTKSVLPEPFATISRIANTGIVLASGLKSVGAIKSTEANIPKAEHGAVFDIGGKRHSAGGTKFYGEDGTRFEAEKDEKLFVLNRLASKTLGPGLSRLNQAAGGRSLMSSSNFLAQGGSVARAVGSQTNVSVESQSIDYDLLSTKVADVVGVKFENSIAKLPHPVTDVKDIIREVNNYNDVVNGANK